MTIEAIAERSGAGKVTIYRWWSHKAAIVLEAMIEDTAPRIVAHASGSPLASLREQMRAFARFLSGRHGRLLRGIVAEGIVDAEVGAAYREHWVRPRRDDAQRLLARAVQAGELVPSLDFDLALDALFGPLYFRFLIGHARLDADFAESIFDSVMSGLAAPHARTQLAVGSRAT